jgi:hypothetical protein
MTGVLELSFDMSSLPPTTMPPQTCASDESPYVSEASATISPENTAAILHSVSQFGSSIPDPKVEHRHTEAIKSLVKNGKALRTTFDKLIDLVEDTKEEGTAKQLQDFQQVHNANPRTVIDHASRVHCLVPPSHFCVYANWSHCGFARNTSSWWEPRRRLLKGPRNMLNVSEPNVQLV